MDLLDQGVAAGLIWLSDDRKRIRYPYADKGYSFTNPEEKVRAEIYLELLFTYGYSEKRLDVELPVPSRTKEVRADIVVFHDDARKQPYIVVECKAPSVSEAEFVQAVEQGFGYAGALQAEYVWTTTGDKSKAHKLIGYAALEREKNLVATIPRFGQTELSRAKYYKGAIDEQGRPAFGLEMVEQDRLTKIFKRAHQALWGGGKRNPSEAFDELDKLIFCKLWDEKKTRLPGQPYDFQEFTGEAAEKLRDRMVAIYREGQDRDPNVFADGLRLSPAELKTVVGYLASLNIGDTDLDSKGRAFETFLGTFFRGDFGQYFTPREVVEFIVDVLPIRKDSRVLDTSCGSGGFLLYALDKVRKQANALAEKGAFKLDSPQHYKYWHDFASQNLFGIEISESIARTAKMNMIIHDDGHTNVVTADGLLDPEVIAEQSKNEGFRRNSFDVILTNPPFGSVVKQTERAYLANYKLGLKDVDWVTQLQKGTFQLGTRDSQSTETLFLEQCHRFLKPGGWLAVVLPDGLLTNSSTQNVRDWIEEHYRIISVVSLPQEAFKATNAGVKSSVLFAQKLTEKETNRIRDVKQNVRERMWRKGDFDARLRKLEDERKLALKSWLGFQPEEIAWDSDANVAALEEADPPQKPYATADKKLIEKSAEFKAWKSALSVDFTERINETKEELREQAQEELRDELRATNYKVLMALPTHIGFDGTGRKIAQNDINVRDPKIPGDEDGPVDAELKRFILDIEAGKAPFFV